MKIFISIILLIIFCLLLAYGSKTNLSLPWLYGNGSSAGSRDVKMDSDIHDAVNFVK